MKSNPFLNALCCGALFACLAIPAAAQSSCTVGSGVNTLIRAEGFNDLTGDIVITCARGTPTAPGVIVPQIDILVTLNGTITSKITATLANGTVMNEALLLMDEPNGAKWNAFGGVGHGLANCGLHGEDSSPSGPGVCSIVAAATPDLTYDGTAGVAGTYGSGRPNVFQGRQASVVAGSAANTIQFLGIPYDPPCATATIFCPDTRTLRIVNIRVNGSAYGVASPFSVVPVIATVSISNNSSISLTNTSVQIGQVEQGLTSNVTAGSFLQCVSTATSSTDPTNPFYSGGMNIRVQENFPNAFKMKNLRQIIDNGNFIGTTYVYSGGLSYNPDYDENVPGAVYGTETGFYFPPTGSTAAVPTVPSQTNPPPGFGTPITSAAIGSRFTNGGANTGISAAGLASQGTRIAITMDPPLAGTSVFVPIIVPLKNQANNAQTGILVLTDADDAGAGGFKQSAGANLPAPVDPANNAKWAPLPANHIAVYEVLFSDPNSQEYADITPALVYTSSTGNPTLGNASVSADFAPSYIVATGANLPSTTLPEPRFASTGAPVALYSINACSVASTTTTAAKPAPLTYSPKAQNASLTATVTSPAGAVNSGTVAFSVTGVGGPVNSGTVTVGAASALFSIPGGTVAGTYPILAAYSGATGFKSSSDSTKLLTINKAVPVITWPNPANIQSGSALGSSQLNATANVPGTFVYTPPAGTVLPVGKAQTLSVTFTPADATNYTTAKATASINVEPAQQQKPPKLVVKESLSRDRESDDIVVAITIANSGGTAAHHVELTVARLGQKSAKTDLPRSLGTIGAGKTRQLTVRFSSPDGQAGATTTITVAGTYTGGTFTSSDRVTLPAKSGEKDRR
jgi:hypothetical protein